jgi:hypothetical protein
MALLSKASNGAAKVSALDNSIKSVMNSIFGYQKTALKYPDASVTA